MNPFDFIKDASSGKKNLMRGTENDKLAEKEYNPYLTNISFSLHSDTILLANEMNVRHDLPNRAQYEFYLNYVRPRNRFKKWPKATSDDALEIICSYYQCNKKRGREYMKLLSKDQIKILQSRMETGGTGVRK